MAAYLDSSAIVKLAVREPESAALRRYLRNRRPLLSSALARVEVLRSLLPGGEQAIARGRGALRRLDLVRINDRILNDAGVLRPHTLRSLDAIHLATVHQLGGDLRVLVTYDDRMRDIAERLGHRVATPR